MVWVNEGCSVVKCKVLWSHGKLKKDWGAKIARVGGKVAEMKQLL